MYPTSIWMIILPLASAPLVYLIGHKGSGRDSKPQSALASRWGALLALMASAYPFFLTVNSCAQSAMMEYTIGIVALRTDGLSLLMTGLALALSTMVVIFSGPYLREENGQEKFYAALIAMTGAIIGLASAGDLFNLWVWFEAMAISSYMLVTFHKNQPLALEAGVKYLVQSSTGSAMVLLGIALVLGVTGTVDLEAIASMATASPDLLAAGALFLIGFGVKAALVPMHTWLPDAHSQAPSGISAMLSGVVIEAGLVAMLRSLAALSGLTSSWGMLFMVFGALNMLLGNLMALRQKQVKRMLAFSSLSHMGYILIGLGIAAYAGELAGAQGAAFHIFNHGLMKGLAFLAAGSLLYALRIARDDHSPLMIDDLNGAARRYPLPALAFSIALLALGGLPPLAGFMSKWQIFVAGFDTGNGWIEALIVFAALNSVLSLGYYAPLINRMYRREAADIITQGEPAADMMTMPLALMSLAVILIGLWPDMMSWLVSPAAQSLTRIFGS